MQGKKECVNHVRVKLFNSESEAQSYCREVSSQKGEKYWTKADIVQEGFLLNITPFY